MSKDYKRIIFVSEMRNPYGNASSTQIMTKNLLYGFRKICTELIFLAIVDNDKDNEAIKKYYSALFSKILFCKDITKHRTDPLKSKISMVQKYLLSKKCYIPDGVANYFDDKTILVSHSPSIDAALICNSIKKEYPQVRYIQYWGDPLALSLITPEQHSAKRFVQYLTEKKIHRYADKIVYGTKSLCDAQLELFPEIADKTISVEVSYCPENDDCQKIEHSRLLFGYFGNYYSHIRDIKPFYDAAKECSDIDCVICGSGDIQLSETDNVRVLNRIPQSEVAEQEAQLDVIVCLLNKVGVQIPGKIFYQTNTNKIILVITDGPNKKKIVEELLPSGRFVFCENNVEAIKSAILKISNGNISIQWDRNYYSPEKICREIVEMNSLEHRSQE